MTPASISAAQAESEMFLPTGKTCSDCAHIRRCLAFGFTKAGNTSCDFHPSRFRLAVVAETP